MQDRSPQRLSKEIGDKAEFMDLPIEQPYLFLIIQNNYFGNWFTYDKQSV